MVEIAGGDNGDERGSVTGLLRDPDVALHLYGKADAALRRAERPQATARDRYPRWADRPKTPDG